jgi:signal transduction histidine kinase
MSAANRLTEPEAANAQQVFRLLVLYRWLSLIPAIWALVTASAGLRLFFALTTAVALNIVVTLGARPLNDALRRRPWLLLMDIALCGALTLLSGGWGTPYYLYSFSPILAGAFFFQWRGALVAAAGIAGLFVLSGLASFDTGYSSQDLTVQVIGFFLIAGAFGYATTLLARLQTSHVDLDRAHRDLAVIHDLTLRLQAAADVNEVQEHVLTVVTTELGYPQAIMALVEADEQVITSWVSRGRSERNRLGGDLPHTARLPLTLASGEIARSVLDGQPRLVPLAPDRTLAVSEPFTTCLDARPYHVFPMLLREHAVGVLLVDASETGDAARLQSLQAIASQAAVAVGTTLMCIDRAQRLAVQDERIRFAREIHDTVSQSLFGLSYSLDACIKLLPEQAELARTELGHLRDLAEATRGEVRQSILNNWPSELTAERFAGDLRRYVTEACRARQLDVTLEVRGDFSVITPSTKRGLYRIAQEALNNVVRHAGATEASVCLDIAEGQALLAVRDNGRGFEPETALAREFDRERFGLLGIRDRAASLGGLCEILSRPGGGTTLLVSVPAGRTLTDDGAAAHR